MNKPLKQTLIQKEQYRKELARLPFEQKIEILGKLQRTYYETKRKVDPRTVQNALSSRKVSS